MQILIKLLSFFRSDIASLSSVTLLIFASVLLSGCSKAYLTETWEKHAPSDKTQLTREVQTMLSEKGFKVGTIDGIDGKETKSALAEFQRSRGLVLTDGVTTKAFAQLKADVYSQPAAKMSREDKETERRQELSKNDERVNFRKPCTGLFVPKIFKKMYQNAVPVYAMVVLNNSENRYSVKYDLVYEQRKENVLGKFGGTKTEEKSFTVRPGAFTEFILIKVNQNGGSHITSIKEIDVFECSSN